MEHRRLEHPKKIAACKKEMDGFCRFGDDKWLYAHKYSLQSKQAENLNEDPELINRLFTMMEKFAERIENGNGWNIYNLLLRLLEIRNNKLSLSVDFPGKPHKIHNCTCMGAHAYNYLKCMFWCFNIIAFFDF